MFLASGRVAITYNTIFEYSALCLSVISKLLPVLIRFASLWHVGLILDKLFYMNMSYSYLITMYESISIKMYIFLVKKYFIYTLVICNHSPPAPWEGGDSRRNVLCFYLCIFPAVRGKYQGFVLYRQKRQYFIYTLVICNHSPPARWEGGG